MDAKRFSWAMALACLCCFVAFPASLLGQQLGQRFLVESQHFRVMSQDLEFAKRVATMADAYRNHLAIHWLGHDLPPWSEKVPLVVNTSPNLPASGETKYTLMGGTIRSIQMVVSGTKERIIDSVLPHEMTHTVLATHFAASGKPVPRWADEGACTTVEHSSERNKHDVMLVKFLTENRGIPFRQLFAMREYPPDLMPLYAQGYSLCAFLIAQAGPRKFVEFLDYGMMTEDWVSAIRSVYGYPRLGDLQQAWNAWVYDGGGDVSQYTSVALGMVASIPQGSFVSSQGAAAPVAPGATAPNGPVSSVPVLIRASQPGLQQTVGGTVLR
ncbi:MAG: hypothetical protein RJB11_3235 [Planctomycetota bacterium]|jgi:hypothetical protein